MSYKRDCEHGSQIGKCYICDLVEAENRIAKLEKENARLKKFVNFQGEVVANSEIEIAELEKERDAALRESKGSLIILDGLKRRIRAAFEVWPDLAMFKDLSCLLNLKSSAVKLEAHNLEQQLKILKQYANTCGVLRKEPSTRDLHELIMELESQANKLREGVK